MVCGESDRNTFAKVTALQWESGVIDMGSIDSITITEGNLGTDLRLSDRSQKLTLGRMVVAG